MGAFSACSLWRDGQAAGIAAPPTLRRPAAASSARLSIGAVKRCNSGLGAAKQASCLCRCTIDVQIAGGRAGGRPDQHERPEHSSLACPCSWRRAGC